MLCIVLNCMTLHNATTNPALQTMRRTEDQVDVGFMARVPGTDKAALEAILTATSGKTWFIRTALHHFNNECEKSTALQAEVVEAILAMRGEEPPRRLEDFLVRVPIEEYTRFNKMFPDKGATTWFMRKVITSYLAQSEGRPTPDAHVLDAVKGILNLQHN